MFIEKSKIGSAIVNGGGGMLAVSVFLSFQDLLQDCIEPKVGAIYFQ